MTKKRTILLGSLLLLIVVGTILALSKMKYGLAKSSPAPPPPTNEERSDLSSKAVDTVTESKSQEEVQGSLEEEWERYATSQFCFLGSDDYSPQPGEDGEPFSYGKLPSAKESVEATVAFLIERIPVKKRTKAHVCPLDNATEGELAVYTLQHILKKNWYELNEGYKSQYANKPESITDQDLLRSIIENKTQAHEMMDEWKRQYEARRHSIQTQNAD